MKPLSSALPQLGQGRDLSCDDAVAVEDILDAALAWQRGELPWWEAAKVGAIAYTHWQGKRIVSESFGRFVALGVAAPDDSRRAALLGLVDELVRQSGIVITDHGLFDRDELSNVTIRRAA